MLFVLELPHILFSSTSLRDRLKFSIKFDFLSRRNCLGYPNLYCPKKHHSLRIEDISQSDFTVVKVSTVRFV